MKTLFIFLSIFAFSSLAFAQSSNGINWSKYFITGQLSVGTANSNRDDPAAYPPECAYFRVGPDAGSKGMLLPRVQNVAAIPSPQKGLICYQGSDSTIMYFNGVSWKNAGSGTPAPDGGAVAFTPSIPFNRKDASMAGSIVSDLTFTPNVSSAVAGGSLALRLVADGSHLPAFTGFTKLAGSDEYNNVPGQIHLILFYYTGYEYLYSIRLMGIVDETPPTIASKTAISAHSIVLGFSEPVTSTQAGYSFSKGTALTITGVSGSGTNTLTFTVSQTLGVSDVITYSYNSNAGNAKDAANNMLASSSGSVTNNISGTIGTFDIVYTNRLGSSESPAKQWNIPAEVTLVDNTHYVPSGKNVIYYMSIEGIGQSQNVLSLDINNSTAVSLDGGTPRLSIPKFSVAFSTDLVLYGEQGQQLLYDYLGSGALPGSPTTLIGIRITNAGTTPVIQAVYSTNNGSTWTATHTFTTTYNPLTDLLYPKAFSTQTGSSVLNPKIIIQ